MTEIGHSQEGFSSFAYEARESLGEAMDFLKEPKVLVFEPHSTRLRATHLFSGMIPDQITDVVSPDVEKESEHKLPHDTTRWHKTFDNVPKDEDVVVLNLVHNHFGSPEEEITQIKDRTHPKIIAVIDEKQNMEKYKKAFTSRGFSIIRTSPGKGIVRNWFFMIGSSI